MGEVLVVVFLVAMIVLPCVAVAYFGARLARRLKARAPTSHVLRKVTRTGLFVISLLTLALLGLAAMRELAPQSPIGAALHTIGGIALSVIAVCIAFVVIGAVLGGLGYPSLSREPSDHA